MSWLFRFAGFLRLSRVSRLRVGFQARQVSSELIFQAELVLRLSRFLRLGWFQVELDSQVESDFQAEQVFRLSRFLKVELASPG